MEKTPNKFREFLRRNIAYIILAFCIIAVGLSVMLALGEDQTLPNDGVIVDGNKDPVDDGTVDEKPDETPNETPDEPVTIVEEYIMPVASASSITEYSEDLVYNEVLKRYSSHLAVDFFAEEGTSVCAIRDGVVKSVDNSLIYGVTVVIDHGNGILSSYNSLSTEDLVQVGQKVKQGDVIGKVSVTNRHEYKKGAHLHFSMTKDGNVVNPAVYLNFEEK